MSSEENLLSFSAKAAADLSALQHRFMVVSGDNEVNVAGDGANAIGVLQNDPDTAGHAATVGFAGISKVEAGGNIAAGADVASGANGVAITAAAADVIVAIAMEAGVSGDVIRVLLRPKGAAA